MKGNYSSMSVANYIVNSAIDKEKPVSNLKLQKLLYYVQAASLVENNVPMFDDDISAWKYGPVVETVYHAFKHFVGAPIDECNSANIEYLDDTDSVDELISGIDKKMIDKVVKSYEEYAALQMVRKTHEEEPWQKAYYNNIDYIDNVDIEKFYSEHKDKIYGKHN